MCKRRTEERRTEEGRTEGRTESGGMAANKTRTPHRDVGKKGVPNSMDFHTICQRPAQVRCSGEPHGDLVGSGSRRRSQGPCSTSSPPAAVPSCRSGADGECRSGECRDKSIDLVPGQGWYKYDVLISVVKARCPGTSSKISIHEEAIPHGGTVVDVPVTSGRRVRHAE